METHSKRPRLRLTIALAAIVLCVAVFHGRTIVRSFGVVHSETKTFLKHNRAYVHSFAQGFTAAPLYAGLYRPLTTSCYYYLGRTFFGEGTAQYKVVNAVFYTANACLLFLICRLLMPFAWALVAALLFASRRAHADQLMFSVEFQTLLSVFFCFAALYFFIRARRSGRVVDEVLSYAAFVLALLSKEPAVMFVAVFFVYGLLFEKEWGWRPYLVQLAFALGWGRWYFFQFRGAADYRVVEFHYSFAPLDLAHNYVAHALSFAGFLIPPFENSVGRAGGAIAAMASSPGVQVFFALLVILLVWFLLAQRRMTSPAAAPVRVAAFGFALFVLSMVPYVIVQDRLLLRYSYVGHAGIAVVLATLLWIAYDRIRPRFSQRRLS